MNRKTHKAKPDTATAPYQPDPNAILTIKIDTTAGLANDFLYHMQVGGNIDNSTELSAAQATQIKNNSAKFQQLLINEIGNQFTKWVEDDRAKLGAAQ